MSNQNENPNNGSKKISWVSIVNAVVSGAYCCADSIRSKFLCKLRLMRS